MVSLKGYRLRPLKTPEKDRTLELPGYVSSNGFKSFIVTGGEIGFMRAWSENIYGIPRYQVVGTEFKLKLTRRLRKPVEFLVCSKLDSAIPPRRVNGAFCQGYALTIITGTANYNH